MNWIHTHINHRTVVLCVFLFTAPVSFSKSAHQSILWIEQAIHFNDRVSGLVYIQAASLANKANALFCKSQLPARINKPIVIQSTQRGSRVMVGPMQTAQQVRQAGLSIRNQKHKMGKRAVSTPKPKVVHYKKLEIRQVNETHSDGAQFPFGWDSSPNDEINYQTKEAVIAEAALRDPEAYPNEIINRMPAKGRWFVSG